MKSNDSVPVPAPRTLDEFPVRILEAYEYMGHDIRTMRVVLPAIFKECQKTNVITQLRSTYYLIEHREFVKWTYKAIINGPDARFKGWIPSINNLLAEIQPRITDHGGDNSHIILYTLLLYFLSPLFSLSDLIKLKGGWHILREGHTFHDVNIDKFLPRSQEEREELLDIFEEIEDPYVRRFIVKFLGLPPIDPKKHPWQRNEPGGDRGDSWGREAQSDIYSRYPDLFDVQEYYEATRTGVIRCMINCISDEIMLAKMVMSDNDVLCECAIDRWGKAIRYGEMKADWSRVHELIKKKPELFKYAMWADLCIIESLWNTGDDSLKNSAIDKIFDYIYLSSEPYGSCSHELPVLNDDVKAGLKLLSEMVDSDKDDFMEIVSLYQIDSPHLPYLVYSQKVESLYDLMWDVILSNGANLTETPEITRITLDLMFEIRPDKLSDITPKDLGSLLPFCSVKTLNKRSNLIIPLVTIHARAADGLVDAIAKMELKNLKEMGWLFSEDKQLRSILLRGLMNRAEPDALNDIKKYCKDRDTSLLVRDQCLDYLESIGESVEDIDPYNGKTDDEILATAKGQKLDKRKISSVWDEKLANSLASLDECAAMWMLDLAIKTEDISLPRTARHLFSLVSEDNQLTFAEALLTRWSSEEKGNKLDWVLLFIAQVKHEGIINKLSKALVDFGRKKPQKANKILFTLYCIGSKAALILLNQVSESKYHKTVKVSAMTMLKRVADERELTVYELGEELVSDYGIEKGGWCIRLGDSNYRVIIANDLMPRVIGDNGKQNKSFPKPKLKTDQADIECAQTEFKNLKSMLASEVKRLRVKLRGDLAAANQWTLDRWKKIYLQHPFVSIFVQGVIWSRLSRDGAFIGSCRISGNELVDSMGKVINIDSNEFIRVWHPCEEDETFCKQWVNNVAESGKSPLFNQMGLPVVELTDIERCSLISYRYQGYKLGKSEFRKLVNRYGLKPRGGDKGYESSFYFPLPGESMAFKIEVSTIHTFYELSDVVIIYYAKITEPYYFSDEISINDVDPITLAMFHSMLKLIADASQGYDENWAHRLISS